MLSSNISNLDINRDREEGYSGIFAKSNDSTKIELFVNIESIDPQPSAITLQDLEPTSNSSISAKDLALSYVRDGDKSIESKAYEQARISYHLAVESNSQLAVAHHGLAIAHYHLRDYEGALSACSRAIECDRTQTIFYYQRALISKYLKDYDRVLADCKWVLQKCPHHRGARWLNSIALVKTANYQVALFNLNQHIDFHPQDPEGYCYRGICYEQLNKSILAIADFDRAIELQPNQAILYHTRGRIHQRVGNLQSALMDFDRAIEVEPQLASVYDDRAEIYQCQGNYLAAIEDGNRAISLNPQLVEAYFRRGIAYTEIGNFKLALLDYDRIIELVPRHIQSYIQRSWIYFRQGNYPLAKQNCQTVRSFSKDCFWANYLRAIINAHTGLIHDAISDFSRSIEIFPYYVFARYHRGLMYYELGDLTRAMTDFNQAQKIQDRGLEQLVDSPGSKLHQKDETGFYAEGLALYHLGHPEAARTVLNLGALVATRVNNTIFYNQILLSLETLGLNAK